MESHSKLSAFNIVEMGPPIEVFALMQAYREDTFEQKVNLGVGAYRTEEGEPWVLPVVKKVELAIANDATLNHEYLPVLGLESFSSAATKLLLGAESPVIVEGKAFGVQTLSGTGALRIGAEFLRMHLDFNTCYISNPSWENHHLLFKYAGFTECRDYRYWNSKSRSLDFEGMIQDLKNAPEKSVVVLHACAHNPTGCDPTHEQWKEIAEVVKAKHLFPFFDTAYQGFASGNVDNDAWAVRYFAEEGFDLMCAQSFAKNFGLYNERVGNLTMILPKDLHAKVKSQMSLIIRAMYSNPPNHGARVVGTILNSKHLTLEWQTCIETMSKRVALMRKTLKEKLQQLNTPGNWDHITTQIGMFSFTGLNQVQVKYLVETYHIYLLKSGRINMCGLNMENIDYVAKAINEAVTNFSDCNCN